MFVAQLDRASDYGSEGYRFESFQTYLQMFSFKNDFSELKFRFLYILLSFFTSFLVCYSYKDQLVFFFSKPLILLTGQSSKTLFIYTHLSEALVAQLKACFIISFATMVIPVFLINMWLYVVPGLFRYERKLLNNFITLFLLFTLFGLLIGYKVFIPFVWKFLMSFSIQDSSIFNPFSVSLEARIKDYIDLIFDLTCLVLVIFQIPFLIVVSLLTGVSSLSFCISHRRYFLLFSWVIAACITPPDILSQSLVAIPLYGLIELTFLAFFCVGVKPY